MLVGCRQKGGDSTSHDLAGCHSGMHRMYTQVSGQTRRHLECDRDGGLGRRRWRSIQLGLFEISIRLTPRQTDCATGSRLPPPRWFQPRVISAQLSHARISAPSSTESYDIIYITFCDANQERHRNATQRSCAQIESYLLGSGRPHGPPMRFAETDSAPSASSSSALMRST